MVKRDQGVRHGSTESSGADTIKDNHGGSPAFNGPGFMTGMKDRYARLTLHLSQRKSNARRLSCVTSSVCAFSGDIMGSLTEPRNCAIFLEAIMLFSNWAEICSGHPQVLKCWQRILVVASSPDALLSQM
jgi:hypothetical protein